MVLKRLTIFTVILISALFFAGTSYAVKINIDPARAELTAKPGEEKTGSIAVLNYDETSPARIKAYVQDLVYLPDGSNDFLTPGSTPWSLGSWMTIGPTEFDIPPGKQATLRYMINVPKDARGGRYGIIFFETTTPPSAFQEVGATVNIRLGSVLLVTVSGTQEVKAKLTKMSVTGAEKGKAMEISWTVFNEGNVIARPAGTLKIIDQAKKEVKVIDVNKEKSGIFPKTNRTFSVKYEDKDKLAKGNYFAQLVLDYGGKSFLGGQSKFVIE